MGFRKRFRRPGGEGGGSSLVVASLATQDAEAVDKSPYLCSVCKSHTLRSGRPLRMFFFEELKAATNNFAYDNYLAEAADGLVFKGVLEGGSSVAVKIVREASAFHAQINTLDKITSPLVVGLIGYCDHEHDRKLLVFDFICNGSLDWHLTSSTPNVMPWATRQRIAVSIGRGILCMHTGSKLGPIQHHNLQSRQILLTHDFTPIIGGMSYAKWKTCHEETPPRPPPLRTGYSAPEHIEGEELTEKADIYSYGVILLELITGRKAFDPSRDLEQQIITEWASPLLADYDFENLIDPNLAHQYNHYELLTMMTAAAVCLKKDMTLRPSISNVLGILEDGGDKLGAVFNSDTEEDSDDGRSSVSVLHSPPCHIVDKKVAPPLHTRQTHVRACPKLSYNEMIFG